MAVIRSWDDPELVFDRVTDGRNELENEPQNQLIGGSVLLICGGCLALIAFWRLYKFCFERLCKTFFISRRAEKYLI